MSEDLGAIEARDQTNKARLMVLKRKGEIVSGFADKEEIDVSTLPDDLRVGLPEAGFVPASKVLHRALAKELPIVTEEASKLIANGTVRNDFVNLITLENTQFIKEREIASKAQTLQIIQKRQRKDITKHIGHREWELAREAVSSSSLPDWEQHKFYYKIDEQEEYQKGDDLLFYETPETPEGIQALLIRLEKGLSKYAPVRRKSNKSILPDELQDDLYSRYLQALNGLRGLQGRQKNDRDNSALLDLSSVHEEVTSNGFNKIRPYVAQQSINGVSGIKLSKDAIEKVENLGYAVSSAGQDFINGIEKASSDELYAVRNELRGQKPKDPKHIRQLKWQKEIVSSHIDGRKTDSAGYYFRRNPQNKPNPDAPLNEQMRTYVKGAMDSQKINGTLASTIIESDRIPDLRRQLTQASVSDRKAIAFLLIDGLKPEDPTDPVQVEIYEKAVKQIDVPYLPIVGDLILTNRADDAALILTGVGLTNPRYKLLKEDEDLVKAELFTHMGPYLGTEEDTNNLMDVTRAWHMGRYINSGREEDSIIDNPDQFVSAIKQLLPHHFIDLTDESKVYISKADDIGKASRVLPLILDDPVYAEKILGGADVPVRQLVSDLEDGTRRIVSVDANHWAIRGVRFKDGTPFIFNWKTEQPASGQFLRWLGRTLNITKEKAILYKEELLDEYNVDALFQHSPYY
jgi:hypothetical protein